MLRDHEIWRKKKHIHTPKLLTGQNAQRPWNMKKKKTHPHPQVNNRTKCSETMKYEKKTSLKFHRLSNTVIGCWRNLILITFGSRRANQAWRTDPGYTPLPKWDHLLCKPPVSLARHLLIQPSGGHPCKQNTFQLTLSLPSSNSSLPPSPASEILKCGW